MANHFYKSTEWSEITKNILGLPRPFSIVPETFTPNPNKKLKLINNLYLHKKFPVPWQSRPVYTEKGGVFNVIEENEKTIYFKNLCGYCGSKINPNEECSRWKGDDSEYTPNDKQGPRLFSDTHPLHIKCMKQAKIYCPYMRERPDEEFEFGSFNILKQHANDDIK